MRQFETAVSFTQTARCHSQDDSKLTCTIVTLRIAKLSVFMQLLWLASNPLLYFLFPCYFMYCFLPVFLYSPLYRMLEPSSISSVLFLRNSHIQLTIKKKKEAQKLSESHRLALPVFR